MIRIYYTADIIRPDGSDTDVYGDACEPGTGATLEMGWLDPDWSSFEVYDNRDDVRPDTWTNDDGPMIEWIVSTVTSRLGLVECNGGPRTYYATADDTDWRTGVNVRRAAHIDAPDAILSAVGYALDRMSK